MTLTALVVVSVEVSNAAIVDEIQGNISDRNNKIKELEKEIDIYQQQLVEVSGEKQTLESAVNTLDLSRKRVSSSIRLTQNRIYSTDDQINDLKIEVSDKERRIKQNIDAIAEMLRRLNEIESNSFVEIMLANDNLTDFWDQIESLQRFQLVIQTDLEKLILLKQGIEKDRRASEKKRRELRYFKDELADEKKVLDINRREKSNLLAITENKESNYKALIEEKRQLRAQFEQELFEFESQLRFAIDPKSIPPTGSGVLRWPIDDAYITQYFGNTKFATQNPQLYNGRGHNGIDLRAAPGTRIKAALSGTVIGEGDTDTVCRNASYGKWILIEHNNGLTTLYAHLSNIKASIGQTVATGDVIGFSGNTGYSTGPHLHFTVYASQGVAVNQLKSRVCNGTYTIPLADFKAYLNPLSYL